MRTSLLFLAAAAAIVPGAAQAQDHHHDHGSDAAQPAQGEAEQEPDAVDHSDHEQSAETDPHSGHVMTAVEAEPEADPHAGHAMPAAASEPAEDPHAGHAMPAAASDQMEDPHAGHSAASPSADGAPPVAGPPPEAFGGPEHAADAIFGEGAMVLARGAELKMHGGTKAHLVLVERLEARLGEGEDGYLLDGQAWYGGDIDKLLYKVEAEGAFDGEFEGAEVQALWSHAITPWFDLQTGVRYDVGPGDDRGHLALGVQGLAPYWIELEGAAFLSDDGDLTATVEAEHDMRITQRLILQPRAEVSFAAQDIPERRLGAGVSHVEVGLRLRYQVLPRFAPYLGVEYEAALGETADRARASGEDPGRIAVLAGVRAWF